MSANFENKKVLVDEIKSYAKDAKAIILVDYKGLTVAQVTELRNNFRKAGAVYKVYKNRLLKIAFDDLGIKFDSSCYDGTTALATSSDVVAPAKTLADFAKTHEVFTLKAGFMDGKAMTMDELNTLAQTPSKETLYAMLAGGLNATIAGLARALNAVAEQQGETA